MAHTYASVDAFKKFLVDGGTDYGTTNDATLLTLLESASRTVDEFCSRSRFGSGFGPRTGTNRYDGRAEATVRLYDDLLSLTSVTLLDSTAGASLGSVAVNTDYYLWPYDRTPYREFRLHGQGTVARVGVGTRVSSFTGSWGYQDVRRTATATAGAIGTTTATTFTIGGTDDLEVGWTLLIDSEQVYLRAKAGTTATIDRGANGTTAATHSAASPIAYYIYPPEVVDATMRVAQRRWKMREAGLTGDYGGGLTMPATSQRDTERAILRGTVGHLAYPVHF